MKDKIHSLTMNETWVMVPKPRGFKTVASKCLYKKKEGILYVEAPRCKLRLVAKGFTHRKGID